MRRHNPVAPLANERGAALIIVLFVVALVTILVLEYYQEAAIELELADNYAQDVQAYQLALAGLQFARAVLQLDDESEDTSNDPWYNFAAFGCVPPSEIVAQAQALVQPQVEDDGPERSGDETAAAAPEHPACVRLSVVDEARKLPVNALVTRETDEIAEDWQLIFERLFEAFEIDTDAVEALIDWIDSSPGHLAGGAEDDYYQGLEHPYETPDRGP